MTKVMLYLATTLFAQVAFAGQFTEKGLQDYIVQSHNAYRTSKLKWPAANMMKLEWDSTLAQYADKWAARCAFDHSNGPYGENLYADSFVRSRPGISMVNTMMQSWGAEMAYDVRIPTPADGQRVGKNHDHYSQIVWAETRKVGCAYALCRTQRIVVCSYYPRGNMDGRGWYIKGPSCSRCPSGTTCSNQLCSRGGSTTPNQTATNPPKPTPKRLPKTRVPSFRSHTRTRPQPRKPWYRYYHYSYPSNWKTWTYYSGDRC